MTEPVNLTNCDREPIHIPGSIQPHGFLLACDAEGVTVLRHSANVPDRLGTPADVNGRTLEHVVGAGPTHSIRNAVSMSREGGRPVLLFDLEVAGGRYDVAVHRYKSTVIAEFEPAARSSRPLQIVRDLIGRIMDVADNDALLPQTARLLRGVLGYDRVMIYRFEHDGAGKVVSESKRPDLESFLGQYFPSSDIPRQARALYLRNTIRVISDADGGFVPIEPVLDGSGEPLDLSHAHLRSVSPIHLEYLRNMGVGASMSISIIVNGELWGLIACHHYSLKVLTMSERVAAEMFGDFFSLHLHALNQKRSLEVAAAARASLDRFLRLASHHSDVGELLSESLDDFRRLLPSDGIGLWMDGKWSAKGSTPPADAIPGLAKFLGTVCEGKVWATHSLATRLPSAQAYSGDAAGVLAIPLSQSPRDYLLFFRKELEKTLEWAGNPEKSYSTGPMGDRLTPRKSFAIWKETVRGQAQPWTDTDRETADAARAATVEVVLRHNELMQEERQKADVRQRMLNEELNHRVKNILSIIKSLVGHPVKEGRLLSDYVASLKGRIQALSHAHDQVIRGDGGGMLHDLVHAELTPYKGQSARVRIEGPQVWLDSRAYSVMALVLHEMATNAAKYGALQATEGKVQVLWRVEDDGELTIGWEETGGPEVMPPSREGFGTALVDRSIPYDLGGRSKVDYRREGIVAEFSLPARFARLASAASHAADDGVGTAPDQPTSKIGNPAVLIVEDQMLIAMDVEAMLEDEGLTRVRVAGSVADALVAIRTDCPQIAILDVNLGDGTSIPVAEELARRGVPFVFATGYGDMSMIPEAFTAAPLVRKPYEGSALVAAMALALCS